MQIWPFFTQEFNNYVGFQMIQPKMFILHTYFNTKVFNVNIDFFPQ